MSPTVKFHVLTKTDLVLHICTLIEELYNQKKTVFVLCETEALTHAIDEALWTYKENTFIPHHLFGEGPNYPAPILIGQHLPSKRTGEVLINICTPIEQNYLNYKTIYEIVPDDETSKIKCRDNYRNYQTRKIMIETSKM